MQSTEIKESGSRHHEPRTIAGLLVSALDMEDSMAHGVYQDYMDRNNWPAALKDETFEEIRKHLKTLLDDTQRHTNMIKHLQSKLDDDNG